MNNLELNDYQIKTSRTGCPVPVVNSIHLHSVYDPKKEATGLAKNNQEILKNNNYILILGLGFGYHIEAIIEEITKYRSNFKIVVIEPNEKIYEDSLHYNPITNENITIYQESNIEILYGDLNLVNFLSEKPAVIAHPASFNLNDQFFRNFITYKADQRVSAISTNIQNEEILNFLRSQNNDMTLSENIKNYIVEKNHVTNKLDHLIIAYNELVLKERSNTHGEK